MRHLLFLSIIIFLFQLGHSQTYFTNTGNKPVTLAIAWKIQSESFTGLICKGWITVIPGGRINTEATGDIWFYKKGDKYKSGQKVLVGTGDFTIQNADMQYVKDQNPKYQWVYCVYLHSESFASIMNSLSKNKKETIIDVSSLRPFSTEN